MQSFLRTYIKNHGSYEFVRFQKLFSYGFSRIYDIVRFEIFTKKFFLTLKRKFLNFFEKKFHESAKTDDLHSKTIQKIYVVRFVKLLRDFNFIIPNVHQLIIFNLLIFQNFQCFTADKRRGNTIFQPRRQQINIHFTEKVWCVYQAELIFLELESLSGPWFRYMIQRSKSIEFRIQAHNTLRKTTLVDSAQCI